MEAVKSPEQNIVFAENQPEYLLLPGFLNKSTKGEFIFCMRLSLKERIKLLVTGKLWCMLLTFNNPLTPSYFTVTKADVLTQTK